MSNTSPEAPQDVVAEPVQEYSLACNGCRRAKLRCSRDRPNCLHCRKTGLNCVYETKRVKPGLKAGAVENLHKRLGISTQYSKIYPIANEQNTVNTSVGQESTAYNILALLAKELPKLVNAQTNRPSPTSSERAEGPSKRRRLNNEDSHTKALQPIDYPELPEPELLEAMISAYFTHIHPLIPMIHQARFRQRLNHSDEREVLVVILHSMIIAASKFVPDASLLAESTMRARRWVVSTAMDNLSLESLQALIILAFTDIGNGDTAKAWSLVGSLTRTVEYSQLTQEHEESDYHPFCRPYDPLGHTQDWTETEERRRVFWNVFNLDRFCNITMGWNTSLTSDDVHRRLPCDGPLWRKQQPVVTPYFGIWDKSAGRIGNPIAFIPQYQSPGPAVNSADAQVQADNTSPGTSLQPHLTDMSTVGAFAYCVEATESMSRVTSYFLQQKINLRDQNEISAWLTRFKELDLRLVHWKMLLPQKWKTNMERQSTLMDPNLTTAHVTHNASMILLHQLIGYPPLIWGFRHRLPSSWSADTCYSAGIEIATITRNYLNHSTDGSPIGSQMLLIHWRYYEESQVAEEFWNLVESLEEMSRRWGAYSTLLTETGNLSAKYAAKLKELYEICARDNLYRINVMDYTKEIDHALISATEQRQTGTLYMQREDRDSSITEWPSRTSTMQQAVPNMTKIAPEPLQVPLMDAGEFSTIPQMILDQHFMNMDRVITFDDGSMFAAELDNGTW
ncbi:hypothetical protein K505DRAFT_346843 [Melanomma pulvis-pyrius CBS 109.77]|uniref:Zn(2)-C6 fungal-type domain-containing protein n=1 Tax=Melanomma pulvis-pyrius CBS 109.77 TaxID=1314802 RepID=A0A6A6XNE7_9PLEO|nr:hypothetical protein K505DRAFT_346843 [Melanomma pulvis-pyrius CBS 109.77]